MELDHLSGHISCSISPEPIDSTVHRRSLPLTGSAGGFVCFEGLVRNVNHGKSVFRLDYEVYEVLALKEMRRIAAQAMTDFQLFSVRMWHRSGSLCIGETAVYIDVLSRHRAEAFRGCRFVIDAIKQRVPIWKKEYYDDGTVTWSQCHEHTIEPAL
ncbi:MAG: molybdenum cofactor biosynthesis protein MoaE [Deltaproteobacteria bacterium]|nr:molybdenum cofactor biosynthesis protein MoaE [Deltaproteobacteria bacterium]